MTAGTGAVRRGTRLAAAGVALAVAAGVLAACTPRFAYASVDNQTGSEVVVVVRTERTTIAPGASERIVVGRGDDCVSDVLVMAGARERVADLAGPVCEGDVVVVERADLVPTSTIVVRNNTGFALVEGWVEDFEVGGIDAGDQIMVRLPVPEGSCTEVEVRFVTMGGYEEAASPSPIPVCDGGLVVVDQWSAWRAPSESEALPPAPPTASTGTVTVINGTDAEIVGNVGLESVSLTPGTSGELPLRVGVEGCESSLLTAVGAREPSAVPVPGGLAEVCDGDTVVVSTSAITVFGPDGAMRAEIPLVHWTTTMASVTVTNGTDVEVLVLVGLNEAMQLAPGESARMPLRTDPGGCVARRLFAEIPGREERLHTEMTEVCDGAVAVVTADAITLG